MATTCMWLAERPFQDSIFTPESVDSNSPKRNKIYIDIYIYIYAYMDIYLTSLDVQGNKGSPPTFSDQ